MRTTKSKKPITVVSVCVAAVACAVGAYRFVYLPLRPADVSHARISINATGKFDESQIDGADGGSCQAEILERLPRGCRPI